MTALSPHFTLEEATFSSTAVRLGVDNACPPELLPYLELQAAGMELVRHALGDRPLHVDSWYRCPALNALVHGAPTSAHVRGLATDFTCAAFGTPQEIAAFFATTGILFDTIIFEQSWVHLSFDPMMRGRVLTAHFGPGGVTYTSGIA